MTINNSRFITKNGLNNNSNIISNVADPINDTDAATLNYLNNKTTTSNINYDPVTLITISNSNSIFILTNGKLYSSHGSSTNEAFNCSGRSLNSDDPFFGVDKNFKQVVIPDTSPIIDAQTDGQNAMVLLQNGTVYGWGLNADGQLGLGHTTAVALPTLNPNLSAISKIYGPTYCGGYNGKNTRWLFMDTAGVLWGCGYNACGALGYNDTSAAISTPQRLTGSLAANMTNRTNFPNNSISQVFNIGNNLGAVILVKTDGTIWGAGKNSDYELGIGTNTQQSLFTLLSTVGGSSKWGGTLAAGETIKKVMYGSHYDNGTTVYDDNLICIWRKTAAGVSNIYTCGICSHGEIGNGSLSVGVVTPYQVIANNATVVDVSMIGSYYKTFHVLAADGSITGWGYNGSGQLGNNTITSAASPTSVYSLALYGVKATALLSDGHCTGTYGGNDKNQCFISRADGTTYVTGFDDTTGYSGTGLSTSITSWTRVKMPKGTTISKLGGFVTHTTTKVYVAVTSNNRMYAWGNNAYYGISGDQTLSVMAPVQLNIPDSQA